MLPAFNGNMLFLARQIRRMGQEDLVLAMSNGMTQGTLSKIERGRIQPSAEDVQVLARALKLRPIFFDNHSYLRQPPVSFHRARKALASKDEVAIHAQAEIYRLSLKKILDEIELEAIIPSAPAIDIEQYKGDAEEIAKVVRKRWELPRGPVADVTKILEDSGIVIITFDFGTPLIDGFCQHGVDGIPPVIFINSMLSKDRLRYSLAHELGHLVMHDVPNPDKETQANIFASEFLMPSNDIRDDFHDLKLTKFMELKLHWGTSMQALIYKAWQVGKLSDRQYKYFFIEMNRRNWRKIEPVDVPHLKEKPSTLRALIATHINQLGHSEEEISEMLGLERSEFASWFPVEKKRPTLRLVAGGR
jgi:Zn-dependent peptidase ImmA (M78 family)